MSKRCCAKNCFNSVLYNRNIAYFSFPKNDEFAQRWAELAGRYDLKDKPLSRITKYYLCSEHFTANCFVDRDTRQILKRKLPHSIALPTIFKNNLQETMQNANPRHSIEVHNIILLDVDERIKDTSSLSNLGVSDCSSQKSPTIGTEKDDFFAYDDFECQRLQVDMESADLADQEEPAVTRSLKANMRQANCRLCFKELESDEPVVALGESTQLKEFIDRVMHKQISVGDDKSQVVCKNCENKALQCLVIIQEMDAAQKKI